MDMQYKCVLITGGCGAMGSCVLNYLLRKYPKTRFVNIDCITYSAKESNINTYGAQNYCLYKFDIVDYEKVKIVFEIEKPELVIHLAAETHVDNSFMNSMRFTRTNVIGTQTILECVKSCPSVKLVIHMSTDEVYGSVSDDSICTEESMFAPSNPYSATKAAAEMICHAYQKSYKVPIIVTRCNNVISPYQHDEKLIPQCVACIKEGCKIKVHGLGLAKRTFIHGDDIANALDIIAQKGTVGSIYNIGTDMEYTVMEVVEIILGMMKPKESIDDWIEYVPDRAFQDYRYCIDSSALRALGWKEQITFKEAVYDVILNQ